jgi:hypothetical protein
MSSGVEEEAYLSVHDANNEENDDFSVTIDEYGTTDIDKELLGSGNDDITIQKTTNKTPAIINKSSSDRTRKSTTSNSPPAQQYSNANNLENYLINTKSNDDLIMNKELDQSNSKQSKVTSSTTTTSTTTTISKKQEIKPSNGTSPKNQTTTTTNEISVINQNSNSNSSSDLKLDSDRRIVVCDTTTNKIGITIENNEYGKLNAGLLKTNTSNYKNPEICLLLSSSGTSNTNESLETNNSIKCTSNDGVSTNNVNENKIIDLNNSKLINEHNNERRFVKNIEKKKIYPFYCLLTKKKWIQIEIISYNEHMNTTRTKKAYLFYSF